MVGYQTRFGKISESRKRLKIVESIQKRGEGLESGFGRGNEEGGREGGQAVIGRSGRHLTLFEAHAGPGPPEVEEDETRREPSGLHSCTTFRVRFHAHTLALIWVICNLNPRSTLTGPFLMTPSPETSNVYIFRCA